MLREFQIEGEKILKEYGVDHHFSLKTNGRIKRTFGYCYHTVGRIELSSHMIRTQGWEEARKTFLHELAHLIVWRKYGERGHTFTFYKVCAEIGGNVNSKLAARAANMGIELDTIQSAVAKYRYTCKCGVVINRFRKIKESMYCIRCRTYVRDMRLEIL